MTWTKLSDDFGDDCWTLSDTAFRLHVEGLVWSNRKLLDLRIPKDDVRRFAKDPEAVVELVAAGWWSEDGDAYVIRHHGQYQRRREDVLKQQEANATNGRKGGRPRKPPREQASDLGTSETHSVTDSPSQSRSERDRTEQDRPVGKRPPTGPSAASTGNLLSSRRAVAPACREFLGGGASCGAPVEDGHDFCAGHLTARRAVRRSA
jgi:hypothetical protein